MTTSNYIEIIICIIIFVMGVFLNVYIRKKFDELDGIGAIKKKKDLKTIDFK